MGVCCLGAQVCVSDIDHESFYLTGTERTTFVSRVAFQPKYHGVFRKLQSHTI